MKLKDKFAKEYEDNLHKSCKYDQCVCYNSHKHFIAGFEFFRKHYLEDSKYEPAGFYKFQVKGLGEEEVE